MKVFILAAGITATLLPPSAADSAVITLGGPLSRICYESALARDTRNSAVDNCTRSLSEEPLTNPDRAATLVNRGILEMISGNDGGAEADFNAALAVDDGLSDAWLNKGFLRLRQHRGGEALPLIQEGINRKPQRQALAIFARGLAYEQMGDLRAAYKDLVAARDMEPAWSLPGQYLARYQVRNR